MAYSAGIAGAAGFAGIELVHILLSHPGFTLEFAASDTSAGTLLSESYPALIGKTDLKFCTTDELVESEVDVAFLAVPHTAAMELAPKLLKNGTAVIDLSADFRLKNVDTYSAWYGVEHTAQDLLANAAFGLPELFGEDLKKARAAKEAKQDCLVGCAGCYPTATSLAAAPAIRAGLLRHESIVVADAVSGVTGAGKKATQRTHFCFANDDVEAYGVTSHRHTPEIEQILDIQDRLVFTPHLAPMNRGILSTVTMRLTEMSGEKLHDLYVDFYKDCPFVEVLSLGQFPRTASVVGTNNVQIGVAYDERTSSAVCIAAIDNLVKGAAGQAVQCANIVFGLPQTEGLDAIAMPI